jgi:hypothetical protein
VDAKAKGAKQAMPCIQQGIGSPKSAWSWDHFFLNQLGSLLFSKSAGIVVYCLPHMQVCLLLLMAWFVLYQKHLFWNGRVLSDTNQHSDARFDKPASGCWDRQTSTGCWLAVSIYYYTHTDVQKRKVGGHISQVLVL